MSSDERRAVDQGIDELKADTFVAEHLGGIQAGRVLGADEQPPR